MKYRPSNGTEGADFIEHWCGVCERDAAYRAGTGDSCPIVANSLAASSVDDPIYPSEWTYNQAGEPICSAFSLSRE